MSWNDVGVAGLSVAVLSAVWKFVDKWAGKFYDVQAKQAEAMTVLAHRVTETSDDQRNTLIVMRSISSALERVDAKVGVLNDRDVEIAQRVESVESKLTQLGEGKWIGLDD